jgi:DnaJ family protein C protein 11
MYIFVCREFRLPEISGVSISQSVEAPLTLIDTTTLSGQASTANGTGNGNVALAWRRLLGPRGWIETEFAAGNGPSLSLRAFRTVTKHVFSNATLTLQATPKGIAPGLNTSKNTNIFMGTFSTLHLFIYRYLLLASFF